MHTHTQVLPLQPARFTKLSQQRSICTQADAPIAISSSHGIGLYTDADRSSTSAGGGGGCGAPGAHTDLSPGSPKSRDAMTNLTWDYRAGASRGLVQRRNHWHIPHRCIPIMCLCSTYYPRIYIAGISISCSFLARGFLGRERTRRSIPAQEQNNTTTHCTSMHSTRVIDIYTHTRGIHVAPEFSAPL